MGWTCDLARVRLKVLEMSWENLGKRRDRPNAAMHVRHRPWLRFKADWPGCLLPACWVILTATDGVVCRR
jgi:hypothetical protein